MFDWNKVPRPQLIKYWKLHQQKTNIQLNELESYQDSMEKQINNQIKHFLESNQDVNSDFDEIEAGLSEEYRLLSNTFPSLFRSSFLVQVLAQLEYQLRTICTLVEKYNYQKFSIADLKGNSEMEKSKIYLKKTIGLDFSELEPEWGFIKNCYQLRNTIIHHQGQYVLDSPISKFIRSQNALIIIGAYQDMKQMKQVLAFSIEVRSFNDDVLMHAKRLLTKIFDFLIASNQSE